MPLGIQNDKGEAQMEGKFALYDLMGNPISYWSAKQVSVPQPKIEKAVGHHVVVIDRSGSMWGAMADTKQMVEKLMTIEEFHDANLLLSLISYSSAGDVTVHFSRVPVKEVNKPGSAYIEQLRQIRATCLTCASQALIEASKLVETETTAISLHTDGWFNDASPASEKRTIQATLKDLAKKPNVFVNTIAYGNYSDFNYLSQIANQMSGACVLATDVKTVYTALHDTTALLAGRCTPAIPLGIDGADWQIALNMSKKKVNGAATDITIRGMEEGDDLRVYRFSKLSKATYDRSSFQELDRSAEGVRALAAFARTQLAEGRINEAKYTLTTMRVPSLLKKHYNALSSDRLAQLALDLDTYVQDPQLETTLSGDRSDTFGLGEMKNDLKSLFQFLNYNTDGFSIHMPKFLQGYQRRSVVRLEGKFQDNGLFVPNEVFLTEDTTYEEDPLVQISGFTSNVAEATVNMTVVRPAILMKNTTKIPRVAGKKLDLSLIRSYTLVGDGEVRLATLPISINDPVVLNRLVSDRFVPAYTKLNEVVEIQLQEFPVVPMVTGALPAPTAKDLNNYGTLLVEAKLLKAVIPAEAQGKQEWTSEQIEELRTHNLSANLVFTAPSTNPYRERNEAAAEGLIDSYTRYTVTLGNDMATDIRTSLWSANEYLVRRFTLKLEGAGEVDKEGWLKKPKCEYLTNPDCFVAEKQLSARTKLTPLDAFVMPIFSDFIFQQLPNRKIEEIKEKLAFVNHQIEAYEKYFSDFAMILGSTGLIPDDWNAEIIPGSALAERCPEMDMPKAHADGTFFKVGDVYVGVHPEVAWYSTAKGVAEAEKLQSLSR